MPHVRARGSIVASLSDVPEAPAVKQMTIAQREEVRLKILREKLDANVQHMTNTVMAAGNGGWRKKEEDIRHDDHSHQVKKRTKVDDVNTHGSSAVAEPAAGTRLCGHRRLPQQEPRREVSRIPPPPSTPAPLSSIVGPQAPPEQSLQREVPHSRCRRSRSRRSRCRRSRSRRGGGGREALQREMPRSRCRRSRSRRSRMRRSTILCWSQRAMELRTARAIQDREHAADTSAQRAANLVPGKDVRGTGDGSICCVYIYVGQDADLPCVAEDIRNHGATIVLMICDTEQVASTMAGHLSESCNPWRLLDPLVKGGGRTQEPKNRVQVQYRCTRKGRLLVAGRRGIGRALDPIWWVDDCESGQMMIVDVGFNVSICQALSMRVAVWDTMGRSEDEVHGAWEEMGQLFRDRGVRLVGGEFYNIVDLAVCNLRKTLSVRVAAAEVYREEQSAVAERAGDDAADSNRGDGDARYLVASGVVLLLGPVLRGLVCPGLDLSTVEERPRGPRDSFDCDMPLEKFREWCFPLHAHWACSSDETHDGSRGWPVFNICKQKKVRTQFMHTQKLSLFLEGANTRRSFVRKDEREEEDTRRATQCAAHGAAWAKKFLTKRHRVIARNP